MPDSAALEFRRIGPDMVDALKEFFTALAASGISRHFHPHPFTAEEAEKLCHRGGKDLYYAIVAGDRILGYGMLRGWEEGFDVPSLGIAFRPESQGRGLGKPFMAFLHVAAKIRGAKRVRLKVYPDNKVAVGLYRALGYRFEGESEGQLVGFIDL